MGSLLSVKEGPLLHFLPFYELWMCICPSFRTERGDISRHVPFGICLLLNLKQIVWINSMYSLKTDDKVLHFPSLCALLRAHVTAPPFFPNWITLQWSSTYRETCAFSSEGSKRARPWTVSSWSLNLHACYIQRCFHDVWNNIFKSLRSFCKRTMETSDGGCSKNASRRMEENED